MNADTLINPIIVNELTQGQQAILYLIPIVGIVVSWIVSLANKLFVMPPKTASLVLVLIGSLIVSHFLLQEMNWAERVNFLVPQIFGGTGAAIGTYEVTKSVGRAVRGGRRTNPKNP